MLKIILSAFLISSSLNYINGQEVKQLQANYEFINLNSDEQQGINLFINKDEAFSEFFNLKKAQDTIYTEEYFDTVNFKIEVTDSINKQYYLNSENITFRDFIYEDNKLRPVVVNESIPDFNWILKDESKTIGEFKCNLALLNFRGREYSVWYSIDIPTPFGPWKFHGLPGLIIEAETTDKSISFRLKKLKYVKNEKIGEPTNGLKLTFKEYVDLKDKEVDDFLERLRSKLPRGAVISVNSVGNNNLEKEFN